MPNRVLTNADTFNSLNTWLDENLQNPFRANSENLPAEDSSRGIYFWFMKPEGYQRLSALGLNITAINPTYNKDINGETYDLVYIGTAGANRKENNTLFKRLNWHLSNVHNENNICHGTLSTLRHTVGAALSNDLIIPNTENDVKEFFSDYFYVYTLPYTGQANTKERIDNDEFTLISVLKALFNIKNNPNARITAGQHPTRQLKVRRGLVMNNTRERLGCKKGNDVKTKSKKDDNKPPKSPINNYELIYDKDGCQEFTVTKEQSVHDVVSGIEGLPIGKCEIVIYNSANPNEYIYTSKHKSGKRVTGTKKKTIYGYFGNSDTSNQPRWKVIQQEMLDKGIEEITVRVCSDALDKLNEIEPGKEKRGRGRPKNNEMTNISVKDEGSKVQKTFDDFKAELDKLNLNDNFKVILTCAGTKHRNKELEYNGIKIDFRWTPSQNNQYKPFDKIPSKNISWKQFLEEINKENANNVIEEIAYDNIVSAYKLYNPLFENRNIYVDLHNCLLDRFFIASAGWGIVRSDFRLPNYDITFTEPKKEQDANKYRNPNRTDFLLDINEFENLKEDDDILFFGSKNYLKQFISLTQNLPNRKVVIYNSQNIVLPNPNPNGGVFIPLYFPFHDKRKGHYAAAQMLIDIYCPNNHE
jgi:hypothetical protein